MTDPPYAKGKRGLIFLQRYKGRTIAVKKKNPLSSSVARMDLEAHFLQKVNALGIGPKLHFFKDGSVGMEYIEGISFEPYIEKESREKILSVISDLLMQLHILDQKGLTKNEMHRPIKHIIVSNHRPVLIDFERTKYSGNPKNVTQFLHYLSGRRVQNMLLAKGIAIQKQDMIALSGEYKKSHSLLPILAYLERGKHGNKDEQECDMADDDEKTRGKQGYGRSLAGEDVSKGCKEDEKIC